MPPTLATLGEQEPARYPSCIQFPLRAELLRTKAVPQVWINHDRWWPWGVPSPAGGSLPPSLAPRPWWSSLGRQGLAARASCWWGLVEGHEWDSLSRGGWAPQPRRQNPLFCLIRWMRGGAYLCGAPGPVPFTSKDIEDRRPGRSKEPEAELPPGHMTLSLGAENPSCPAGQGALPAAKAIRVVTWKH